ncbi:hypothetical protein ALO70_101953 [Pseudomonas amygdali pv. eriobotryae]|uniref:Uncharacterized protein n=2 Tax=Pseudomonas syringae group genomosp. 2 TaxID=251698 RepID=A0A0P9R1J6_PSEA0|nr:hypothetical protein ALO70_101953 [Pseudomonas amygdali pv. eriobotryae]RMO64596.1 hypothetical protein ALQ39_102287 [Pseudomonas amygdali pv. eriobotryae]RMP58695.1 hypothetical protein ALQ22_101882 [Pseudomonas savastanoi pv. retacarpa]RMT89705.1 hypothetical protein ALP41_102090 [Pseudomonas savastanoi pv. nerii]RMV08889.1 hypothetical protein ALP16_102034 [Pseudomonas savastanoi]
MSPVLRICHIQSGIFNGTDLTLKKTRTNETQDPGNCLNCLRDL